MNLIELVSFYETDFQFSVLLGGDEVSRELYQKKTVARVWKALKQMEEQNQKRLARQSTKFKKLLDRRLSAGGKMKPRV